MSKRLSELLDYIAPQDIEDINLQTDDEAISMEDISLERIKALAMSEVEESSKEGTREEEALSDKEKVISIDKRGRRRRKTIGRWLIPLVAAVSLSLGIVAATQNTTLSHLFGQFFPYEDQVQSISKSMSASGLIFTAEGAFIDEKTGLFIASFERKDGLAFEDGTVVQDMKLEMNKPNAMGWNTYNELSEDKKKLICIVNLSSSQRLYGKKLNLQAEDLSVWRNIDISSELDLAEVEKVPVKESWKNYNSTDGIKIKLSEEAEGLMLDRIDLSDGILKLVTSFPDKAGIEDQSFYLSLINQKTGEIIEAADYERYWSEEEGLNKSYTWFKNITQEDLKDLRLSINSQYSEILTKGSWNIDFSLDRNSQVITKKVNKMIGTADGSVFIRKVQVSALGVTLQGMKLSRGSVQLSDIYLELKNGLTVPLWQEGMNSKMVGFNVYLKGDMEVKQEKDESIEITDDESSLALDSESFDWGQFIDIDEVQSIVIEGTRIPLV